MKYIPQKNKKAQHMAFALIIGGFILVMIAVYIPFSWAWQLIAAALIAAGVQLAVRYVLCEYRYIIEDLDDGSADLIVYKKQGRNDVKVCHVTLSCIELISKTDALAEKPRSRCVYVQNVAADTYTLVYTDEDERVGIVLECDEAFINAVNDRAFKGDGSGTKFAM